MISLIELLKEQTDLLKKSQVDSPRLSAEVLLAFSMGLDTNSFRILLITEAKTAIPQDISDKFKKLILRRALGEPVAYLTGEKEFFGYKFKVSPATLIPRPETELLVETSLKKAHEIELQQKNSSLIFADLGTGTGCIAISLALNLANWTGIALDLSWEATKIAWENKKSLKAQNLAIIQGNFKKLPLAKDYGLIVSNPPYISSMDYKTLGKEVKNFEPKSALVPDNKSPDHHNIHDNNYDNNNIQDSSGLEDVKIISENTLPLLSKGGFLIMEIGWDQGEKSLALLKDLGFIKLELIKDLAGLDRILVAQRP